MKKMSLAQHSAEVEKIIEWVSAEKHDVVVVENIDGGSIVYAPTRKAGADRSGEASGKPKPDTSIHWFCGSLDPKWTRKEKNKRIDEFIDKLNRGESTEGILA